MLFGNIAFDIDSTVIDSFPIFTDEIYKETGIKIKYEDHINYDFMTHISHKCDLTTLIHLIMQGEKRQDFKELNNAFSYLELIYKLTRKPILFITARNYETRQYTKQLIHNLMNNIPYEIIYTNDKNFYIDELNIEYFVDDRFKTCENMNNIKGKVFCVNSPWNMGREFTNKKVIRINNLYDIVCYMRNKIWKLHY